MVDDKRPGFDFSDDDWDAEAEDDFLFHLVQGGELLRSGRMVEAKEHLEKAFSLKPDNARGQNMLGLVYFKLGLYQRAIDIGRSLIARYPEDVTLRVNLAMIQLKAGQLEQAEQSLLAALALDAEHVNAHRYLGLVLARLGRLEQARVHFESAGVQDVERLLAEGLAAGADSRAPDSSPPALDALDQVEAEGYRDLERAQATALQAEAEAEDHGQAALSDPGEPRLMGEGDGGFSDHGPVEMGADLDSSAREEPASMASIPPTPVDAHEKALSEVEVVAAPGADEGISAPTADEEAQPAPVSIGAAEVVTMPGAPSLDKGAVSGEMLIEGDRLVLTVEDRVFLRASELGWIRGDLRFHSVFKRFAGKETRHPFDRGEQAMVLAEGSGKIQLRSPAGKELHLLEHVRESIYLAEQHVFAFSFAEAWENGRLPAVKGADLAIFHLFEPAKVVLELDRSFERCALREGERLRLHVRQLVGWTGELLPRLIEPESPLPGGLWIELSGQGEVLCLR